MTTRSLLQRIEDICNVDVDDASTEVIKSLPFTPHNQTSNQAIITNELLKDPALIKRLVQQYGSQGWEHVYDQAAVHLCARNIPHLSGRVLIQTSLRHLHDRDAIIAQCRSYASLFAQHGVPRDRFAIKLPFSGAAASAALQLNGEEGIRTLATAVFSLEQGIAASQSGCLFISPYYNEIAAHLDPALRPSFEDPALEHPMSPRVIHILEAFAKAYKETGKEQPIMVIASHFTPSEILAMTELNCPHITIPPHLLTTLLQTPDTLPLPTPKKTFHYAEYATAERLIKLSTADPLAGPDWDGKLATAETDFVADGGAKLDAFIKSDPVASKRVGDAEAFFLEMEDKARIVIEKEMAAQGF
ncbi:Transaldolase-like protein [Cladobotryum mycophilum]|uniref:Transaldolase-like protein n=1 Tax=Cladobotryum mycophilum TaxID=491253 RepID=A0ABR0SCI4_9HYPO